MARQFLHCVYTASPGCVLWALIEFMVLIADDWMKKRVRLSTKNLAGANANDFSYNMMSCMYVHTYAGCYRETGLKIDDAILIIGRALIKKRDKAVE